MVSRSFNTTKLRGLGTVLNTSIGRWRCHLAACTNAVRFEIGGVVVAHVTEGDVRIIRCKYQRMNDTTSAKNRGSTIRAAIAVTTTTSKA